MSSRTLIHTPPMLSLVGIASLLLIGAGIVAMYNQIMGQSMHTSDFTQDYVAAQALRAGRSIYTDFAVSPLRPEDVPHIHLFDTPEQVRNFHPPFTALLFVPLTFLSYPAAFALWGLLSTLLYAATGALVLYELELRLLWPWRLLLLGLALSWYPFHLHLHYGQLSLLLIVCILGAWALLRQGRPLLAGTLLGLACLIKLFPALIVATLVLSGLRRLLQHTAAQQPVAGWRWPPLLLRAGLREPHWQAVGAAGMVMLAGSLFTLLVVGTEDMLHYAHSVIAQDVSDYSTFVANLSTTGIFSRLFVDGAWKISPLVHAPWLASLLTLACNLAVLAIMTHQIWHLPPNRDGFNASFALACLAMLLISPISWQHMFPLLCLHFGLLFQHHCHHSAPHLMGKSMLALVLVSLPSFMMAGLLRDLYAPEQIPWSSALVMILPTAGLVLLWWLIARTAKEQPLPAHDQPHSILSQR